MGAAAVELTTEQEEIVSAAAELAKRAVNPESTELKRVLASKLVELRATFLDAQGRPDYKGSSAQYRAAAKEVYGRAELGDDEREKLRWAVNNHLRLELRKMLTSDELTAYGLKVEDSNTAQRERMAKVRKPATTADDFLTRVRALRSQVEEMSEPAASGGLPLDGLTADTADRIADELAAAQAAWTRVTASLHLPAD